MTDEPRLNIVFEQVHPSQMWKLVVHMEANPCLFHPDDIADARARQAAFEAEQAKEKQEKPPDP